MKNYSTVKVITYLFLSILSILIASCMEIEKDEDKKNLDEKFLYKQIKFQFSDVSDRATAYTENNKIISLSQNRKIITYLDKNLGVHLVLIENNYVLLNYILDYVKTNHGGGTLVKVDKNKFCIIYGGHIEPLKISCVYINNNNFIIDKSFLLSEIDPFYNNPYPFWQTYPYAISVEKGIIGILFREELGSIRYPRLVYMEISIDKDIPTLLRKIIVFETKDYYANFMASFVKSKENIYILWRYFGKHTIDEKYFNKGIFLSIFDRKSKVLNTFSILRLEEDNLRENPYISNIQIYNGNIYFLYINFSKGISGDKNLNLCKINTQNFQDENNISCSQIALNSLIGENENLSTTLNLFVNTDNSIFIAFNTKKEKKWTSISNKIYYVKYNVDTDKILKILNDSGWFPSIEKKNFKDSKPPCLLWHNIKSNSVNLTCFK